MKSLKQSVKSVNESSSRTPSDEYIVQRGKATVENIMTSMFGSDWRKFKGQLGNNLEAVHIDGQPHPITRMKTLLNSKNFEADFVLFDVNGSWICKYIYFDTMVTITSKVEPENGIII